MVPFGEGRRNMPDNRSPGRAGSPISLDPLTPEEALRRAMRAPVPNKSAYKPPDKLKAAKKHPAKQAQQAAARKKG